MWNRRTNALASKTNVLATLSSPRVVAPEFFGTTFHRLPGATQQPAIDYKTVRTLDHTGAGSDPIGWKTVETNNGTFVWTIPDAWVAYHSAAGKDLVWNFGTTPDWAVSAAAVGGAGYGGKSNMPPDNNADWIDYITQVVNRYPQIKYFEGWNEPNLAKYYAGTAARLAELQRILYQTVKALRPDAVVLSPCYTSVFSGIAGLQAYLSASDGAGGTGKSWFDVLSYHPYANDDCRRITSLERMTRGIKESMAAVSINKPLWASEFGFITPEFKTFTVAEQRQLMRLHVLTLLVLGWERVIFYAWDNVDIGPTDGVAAWDELTESLSGHTITAGSIQVYAQNNFTVEVVREDGVIISESFSPMP